jgi:hypothetical protein
MGGFGTLVSQEITDPLEGSTSTKQVRGETMPENVSAPMWRVQADVPDASAHQVRDRIVIDRRAGGLLEKKDLTVP